MPDRTVGAYQTCSTTSPSTVRSTIPAQYRTFCSSECVVSHPSSAPHRGAGLGSDAKGVT
eukprot:2009080-Rhodomonas_salina.1